MVYSKIELQIWSTYDHWFGLLCISNVAFHTLQKKKKKGIWGWRDQRLRTKTALVEDPGSVLRTHLVSHKPSITAVPEFLLASKNPIQR